MAAGTWIMYNQAKEWIGDGTIDLDGHEFKMALFLSTSNCATLTHDEYGDLDNEHANGNGYTTGGAACTGTISAANQWLRTDGTVKFDCDDVVWTASGGSITARYAVIYDDTHATKALLCYCLLDSAPADVTATTGNTLTVTIHADGVFTLSGMAS
jgi:hypothetical protein